jgi:transposase InsO family protein
LDAESEVPASQIIVVCPRYRPIYARYTVPDIPRYTAKTLKREEVDGGAYRDATDARNRIGSFIEQVYNRQRLHSALDYRPPEEFEALLPIPRRTTSPAMAYATSNCP